MRELTLRKKRLRSLRKKRPRPLREKRQLKLLWNQMLTEDTAGNVAEGVDMGVGMAGDVAEAGENIDAGAEEAVVAVIMGGLR